MEIAGELLMRRRGILARIRREAEANARAACSERYRILDIFYAAGEAVQELVFDKATDGMLRLDSSTSAQLIMLRGEGGVILPSIQAYPYRDLATQAHRELLVVMPEARLLYQLSPEAADHLRRFYLYCRAAQWLEELELELEKVSLWRLLIKPPKRAFGDIDETCKALIECLEGAIQLFPNMQGLRATLASLEECRGAARYVATGGELGYHLEGARRHIATACGFLQGLRYEC